MNYLSFVSVIMCCCYYLEAASDGSPYMWLIIRQLERTSDDFKKLVGQMQEIKAKVDSNGKHLDGLGDTVNKLKSQMDKKISTVLEPVNESIKRIQVQSDNNANGLKIVEKIDREVQGINTKVNSFGKHVDSLRVDLEKVRQNVKAQSGNNENRFKAITTKYSVLENSVEHLKSYHECQTGWKEWEGHCYYFSSEHLNWTDSKLKCNSKASHLVKIENSQKNNMLVTEAKRLGGRFYWTGANDISSEGKWKWDSDGTAISYSDWYPNEPNDIGIWGSNADCGHIHSEFRYQWDDHNCRYRQNYICEKGIYP